jgi:FkbM family methyltransferase
MNRLKAWLKAGATRAPVAREYIRLGWQALTRRRWQASAPLPCFSQFGEDRIADFLLEHIGIHRPSYIDIGASDPFHLSNTAIFYLKGGRGIIVDPREATAKEFSRRRPADTCVTAGVAASSGEAEFFEFDVPELCTFDKRQAEFCMNAGKKLLRSGTVPLVTVKEILARHHGGRMPDLLSLDVEGWELPILESCDLAHSRPKVIICEVVSFGSSAGFSKERRIRSLLELNGFRVVADTFVNVIAVDVQFFPEVPGIVSE